MLGNYNNGEYAGLRHYKREYAGGSGTTKVSTRVNAVLRTGIGILAPGIRSRVWTNRCPTPVIPHSRSECRDPASPPQSRPPRQDGNTRQGFALRETVARAATARGSAAKKRWGLAGACMPIPVRRTGFTRVLAVVRRLPPPQLRSPLPRRPEAARRSGSSRARRCPCSGDWSGARPTIRISARRGHKYR